MHTIFLIGDATLAPYTGPLEAEGFDVNHLLPAAEPPTASPDAVIIDLAASAEDPLARRYLEAHDDPREVVGDIHARYYGTELDDNSLTTGSGARIAPTRFEDWLSQSVPA